MFFTRYFGLRFGFRICRYGRVPAHAHAQEARACHQGLALAAMLCSSRGVSLELNVATILYLSKLGLYVIRRKHLHLTTATPLYTGIILDELDWHVCNRSVSKS